MKFSIEIEGSIKKILKDKKKMMGIASTSAVGLAAKRVQGAWRNQVQAAGLGTRLANSVRVEMYPEKGFSYNPAAKVFTRADKILDAYNRGVVIHANNGIWLAIPTKEAGIGDGGRKITPALWKARTGRTLRVVVNRRKGTVFLVADDQRLTKRGVAVAKGGKRRRDGILTGAQTIIIFNLVRQVRLPKRLDFEGAANQAMAGLPGQIVAQWKD